MVTVPASLLFVLEKRPPALCKALIKLVAAHVKEMDMLEVLTFVAQYTFLPQNVRVVLLVMLENCHIDDVLRTIRPCGCCW